MQRHVFQAYQVKQEIKQIMVNRSSNAGHWYELRLEFLHVGVRSGRSADGVGEGKCGGLSMRLKYGKNRMIT